jgi:hypothetical protein
VTQTNSETKRKGGKEAKEAKGTSLLKNVTTTMKQMTMSSFLLDSALLDGVNQRRRSARAQAAKAEKAKEAKAEKEAKEAKEAKDAKDAKTK